MLERLFLSNAKQNKAFVTLSLSIHGFFTTMEWGFFWLVFKEK